MTRSVRSALLALVTLVATLALAAPASAAIDLTSPAAYEVFEGTPVADPPIPHVLTADVNRDGYADAVATDGDQTVRVALGGASGLGATATVVSDPHLATAIAVGDVTGDGRPDIVTDGSHDLSVYPGNGNGTFSSGFVNGSGFNCGTAHALGDVNRDGDLDVVATCPNGTVVVNHNDGAGNFTTQTSFVLPLGAAPSEVELVDVDRDGTLDVVANETDAGGNVYVAPGNGDATFGLVTTVAGFGARDALAVADLDRDGILDLVGLVGGNDAAVSVALGNGDRTFGASASIELENEDATDLAVADLDHDGKLDVVTGGLYGVETLAGNGDGTLQLPVEQSPVWLTALALGDVDADGRTDVALLDNDGDELHHVRNTTTIVPPNVRSTVTPLPVTGRGPVDTVVADVNRDGIPDLVVAEQTEYRVAIFIGNGNGTYQERVEYWPGGNSPQHPVVADMNLDGNPDIVVGNYLSASVSVMLGHGDGTFDAGAQAKVTNTGFLVRPQGVQVGDFDRDGVPDVAISADQDSGNVAVLLGNGDGTLGSPINNSVGGNLPDLASGDFNRDGKLDLVAASYNNGRLRVLLGNGNGTFAAPVSYFAQSGTYAVRVADLDRDGMLDLVTANLGANSVSVLLGNGDGTFAAHIDTAVTGEPRGLDVGDINGDGHLDVAQTAQSGTTVGVLYGNGDGTLDPETTHTIGSSSYAVTIGDLNRDGRNDLVVPSYTGQRLYILLAGLDAIPPSTSDNVPAGWATAAPFRPTLTATDSGGGTVATTYYEVGNPPATPTTSSPVYNPANRPSMTDGQQISYFSVDSAGNTETVKTSGAVKIDANRPTTADDVPTAWQKTSVTVTLTASDTGGSGVATTRYTIGTSPSNPNGASPVYNPASKPVLTNGQRIRYQSLDVAGNVETSKTSQAARVDTAVPTVTDNVPTGWRKDPVTVTLTAADTGGSGLAQTYYDVGASPATPTTASSVYNAASKPVLQDGQRISYLSTDTAGNDSGVKTSSAAQVDQAVPATTDDVPSAWQNTSVTVTLTPSDTGGSSLDKTYYEVGVSPATPTTSSSVYNPASKPLLQDGQKISYFSTDVAGNTEAVRTSEAAKVDTAAPTVADDVPSAWQNAPVTVTLTPSDTGGSGLAQTYYEVGSSPATPTTSSEVYDPSDKPVLQDGQKISYFTRDVAGNDSSVHTSDPAKVDEAVPTTSDDVPSTWQSAPVAVTLTAADTGGSGLAQTYYEIGSPPATPTTASSVYDPTSKPELQDGERISYFSTDIAGNAEAVRTSDAAQVDEHVPDTLLDDVPAAISAEPQPTVTFSSDGVDTTFECAVDGASFDLCMSPFTPAAPLLDGEHEIAVRAKGRSGLIDPTPASITFVVDTTAPDAPTLVEGPPATSTSTDATVRFSGEDGATFTCAVDGGADAPCSSPLTLAGLALGAHTVRIDQTDQAGNRSEKLTVAFSVLASPTSPQDAGKPSGGETKPEDPTVLSPTLGQRNGWSSQSAILIADISAVACSADRGRVASCQLEAFRARGLRTKTGERLPAGAVLATGSAAGEGSTPLMTRLRLTANGRKALAGRPLGLRVRLRLRGTGAHGSAVVGATRARLMKSDTVAIPITGRPQDLPQRTRRALVRFVRALGIAKTVRCAAYTDASGDVQADRELTVTQAKAACGYLAARGLKAARTTKGYGSSRPQASNRTERGRALNRRLAIRFTLEE